MKDLPAQSPFAKGGFLDQGKNRRREKIIKKINPSTFPGLKPGVCSGLNLSGALPPVLKDGLWRRRSIIQCDAPGKHYPGRSFAFGFF